ncbi:MAG TPA: hypothetical protein VNU68_27720 [Verrucomicrobiae bacterium]|nr:hypothetical protein [Verrucomicrobiae bacterium]
MKLFRNPVVAGGLALVAVFMVVQAVNPNLFKKRPARQPATAQTPAPAPATAGLSTNLESSASAAATSTTPSTGSGGAPIVGPEANIDLSKVGWPTNAAPRRDPFQVINAPSTNRLYPPAWQVLELTAIWRQTGGKLAVINRKVLGEGDSLVTDLKGTPAAGAIALRFTIELIEDDLVWVSGPSGREPLEFKPLPPAQTKPSPGRGTAMR